MNLNTNYLQTIVIAIANVSDAEINTQVYQTKVWLWNQISSTLKQNRNIQYKKSPVEYIMQLFCRIIPSLYSISNHTRVYTHTYKVRCVPKLFAFFMSLVLEATLFSDPVYPTLSYGRKIFFSCVVRFLYVPIITVCPGSSDPT